MKKQNILLALLLICGLTYSQNSITATLTGLANQKIKLVGFNGLDTYIIDSTQIDEKGNFNLSYGEKDYGIAYLSSEDGKSFVIIIANNESIKLKGETIALPQSLVILKGKQNLLFEQYANELHRREQCLSAWNYLTKIYTEDSLFLVHETPIITIEKEKQRIKLEDDQFLANLPKDSYVSWYLPIRKMVSSVSAIAQYRTNKLSATINTFRKLDYTDNRFYKSGLLKEAIEAHFWLIENSRRSLDSVYVEMKTSIDAMLDNLLEDEQKLNEITEYLFKLLEKRSLFNASEYLALKLLNEQACTINNDFSAQLESYRAMKKGNLAPDITFPKNICAPAYTSSNMPQQLSSLNSNYTVVIFGASWCPQCPKELSQITAVYQKWKQQGLEVVFVSLDEDEEVFKRFASIFPFISTCDYKKWDSPIVTSYHVFATPTIYLLNNKQEIILRPNSVSQLDSWVDWYLLQNNNKNI